MAIARRVGLQQLSIGPEERMRSVELADRDLVGDQSAEAVVWKPCVQVKGRRLDLEYVQPGTAEPGALATVATKLPLRLSATMEAASPSESLATVFDVERGIVGVYGVGDEIRAGEEVEAVADIAVAPNQCGCQHLLEFRA